MALQDDFDRVRKNNTSTLESALNERSPRLATAEDMGFTETPQLLQSFTSRRIWNAHGPYAESKEQLVGFRRIEAADLDAPTAWAARSPTAVHGVVEVRPLWEGTVLTRNTTEFVKAE